MTHTHFLRRGSSIIGSGGPAFHPNTVAAAAHCSLHICQAYPRRFVYEKRNKKRLWSQYKFASSSRWRERKLQRQE